MRRFLPSHTLLRHLGRKHRRLHLRLQPNHLVKLRAQLLHHSKLHRAHRTLLRVALRHERGGERGEVGGGVDLCSDKHVHGLLSELERVDRLKLVSHGGRHADDEGGARGAADGVGEQPRQLRFAKGRALLLLRSQNLDAPAERGERLVDGLCLVERSALDAALLDALRSGQVDQMQLAREAAAGARARDLHDEHGVRSRRICVHLCCSRVSILVAVTKRGEGVVRAADRLPPDPRDVHALLRILTQLDGILRLKQVRDAVEVDLDVRELDLVREIALF
mmetsp:Transcript_15282/g.32557  ORF Transcript_15282/g.32557 Transcript_15282/m.32557 type:complete len:279 (-) Transcript_15282:6-842(-)